ncbi:MAG: reprolysin-like metallopeptidase [Actinomycetota bacterium]
MDLRRGEGIRRRSFAVGVAGALVAAVLVPAMSPSPAAAAVPAGIQIGTNRIAIVLVNFFDDPVRPFTVADARAAAFTNPDSAQAWFHEVSQGKITLTGDVYNWVTTARPSDCRSVPGWAGGAADEELRSKGRQPTDYNAVVAITPPVSCPSRQGQASGRHVWMQTRDTHIFAHELGHTMGLDHANAYRCYDTAAKPTAASQQCTNIDYGDPFDTMGAGSRHFQAYNLVETGLMPPANVRTIQTAATYSLTTSETVRLGAIQLLRIPRMRNTNGSVRDWYYVELRRPSGQYDDFAPTDPAVNGVLVRIAPLDVGNPELGASSTLLLDAVPETDKFEDAALLPGRSIRDESTGVEIRTVGVTGSQAHVAVSFFTPPRPSVTVTNGVLVFRTPAGFRNQVTFAHAGAFTVDVDDANSSLNLGPGCVRRGVSGARCGGVWSIDADFGDLVDRARVVGPVSARLAGGPGNDDLGGGPGADILDGGADNDIFETAATPDGGDTYLGGSGQDSISYSTRATGVRVSLGAGNRDDGAWGEGDDVGADVEDVYGSQGNDVLVGTNGPNELWGNGGSDWLLGGLGADRLNGGAIGADVDLVAYNDHQSGVSVSDDSQPNDGAPGEGDLVQNVSLVVGSDFDDTFHARLGSRVAITYLGVGGNDTFTSAGRSQSSNLVTFGGGAGIDTVSYAEIVDAGVVATIGTGGNGIPGSGKDAIGADIEDLIGGAGNDALTGNANDNLIMGGRGNDTMAGGGGVDTLSYLDHDTSVVVTLPPLGQTAVQTVSAGERDTFTGFNNLNGGGQVDILTGNADNNVLMGAGSDDRLLTGGGRDTASFADHVDRVTVAVADPPGSAAIVAGRAGERDTIAADIQDFIGGQGPDVLIGNRGPNVLDGQGGDDDLLGGGGDDTLRGGGGRDRIYADGPPDAEVTLSGALALTTGTPGLDTVDAGPGDDFVDVVDGRRDVVECGPGVDKLFYELSEFAEDIVTNCEDGTFVGWGKLQTVPYVDSARPGPIREDSTGAALTAPVGDDDAIDISDMFFKRNPFEADGIVHLRRTARTWQYVEHIANPVPNGLATPLDPVRFAVPAATTLANNQIVLATLNSEAGALAVNVNISAPGPWTGWSSWGAPPDGVASQVAAARLGDGYGFAVFVTGADQHVWGRAWTGTTLTPWIQDPNIAICCDAHPSFGAWGQSPAATAKVGTPATAAVFYYDGGHELVTNDFACSGDACSFGAGFVSIGCPPTGAGAPVTSCPANDGPSHFGQYYRPAATSTSAGWVQVFGRPDGRSPLWERVNTPTQGWNPPWSRVHPLSETIEKRNLNRPAATSPGFGRIHVVAVSSGIEGAGTLREITFDPRPPEPSRWPGVWPTQETLRSPYPLNEADGRPAVASSAPGKLDVVMRRSTSRVAYASWDATNGWRGYMLDGPRLTQTEPAIASAAPGRVDIVVTAESRLSHMWRDAQGFHNWSTVPGDVVAMTTPTVVVTGPNRLDLYVVGQGPGEATRAVWHTTLVGSVWSPWNSLGAPSAGLSTAHPPTAVANGSRIDVFVRANNIGIWYTRADTAPAWRKIVGHADSDPVVVSPHPLVFDVFVRSGQYLRHARSVGGDVWSNWDKLGEAHSAVAAVASAPNILDVFFTCRPPGAAYQPCHLVLDARNGKFTREVFSPLRIGTSSTTPAAFVSADGSADVFWTRTGLMHASTRG